MKVVIIAAVSENRTIGDSGKIPWHISEDLRRFKRVTMDHTHMAASSSTAFTPPLPELRNTMGHVVIMGRKTFDSIGRALPGRSNLVLTRNPHPHLPRGVKAFPSLKKALAYCRKQNETTAFIIGGAQVYRAALRTRAADTLLLTHVYQKIPGDTKFPRVDFSKWEEFRREDAEGYSFVEYARRIQ